MIDDQAEYEHVFEKMRPVFDQRLLEKGFVALTWGDTGTVHLFFNKEIKALADLKGVKMFTWAGDPNAIKSMAAAGFQPVVISSTDILPSLQTGDQSFATPVMAFTAAGTRAPRPWSPPAGASARATIVRKESGRNPRTCANAGTAPGMSSRSTRGHAHAGDAIAQMKKERADGGGPPPPTSPAGAPMPTDDPLVRGGVSPGPIRRDQEGP
jgi:hypothetical protein